MMIKRQVLADHLLYAVEPYIEDLESEIEEIKKELSDVKDSLYFKEEECSVLQVELDKANARITSLEKTINETHN